MPPPRDYRTLSRKLKSRSFRRRLSILFNEHLKKSTSSRRESKKSRSNRQLSRSSPNRQHRHHHKNKPLSLRHDGQLRRRRLLQFNRTSRATRLPPRPRSQSRRRMEQTQFPAL